MSATKAGRQTPLDALSLPHVVEAIATSMGSHEDFESFLRALPRSLWTPALTAFLDCPILPSVRAQWPWIRMNMSLPPDVWALLKATLPLRPRMRLYWTIRGRWHSLLTEFAPALSSVTLHFFGDTLRDGQGHAISNFLLQHCPRLRLVRIDAESRGPKGFGQLDGLLAVINHPHVEELDILLGQTNAATPRLGHLLASWLSTAPATILSVAYATQMDDDAAIAFCDALQANTTLQELTIISVPSLGGFHGRTLPVSLKTLKWNAHFNGDIMGVIDDATMADLGTAVGPTRIKRLVCSAFGQLATCPAAAPMLLQLQYLEVPRLNADRTQALIAGLSTVPALTSLVLRNCNLSPLTELLMETLAMMCVHLETLSILDHQLTQSEATAVLAGVLQLPRLTRLVLTMHLSDVRHRGSLGAMFFRRLWPRDPWRPVLPALVAAGRQLRVLHLWTIVTYDETVPEHGAVESKLALCRALAGIPNVPFVVETLPEDIDAFVVDALGPRADRGTHCRLILDHGVCSLNRN